MLMTDKVIPSNRIKKLRKDFNSNMSLKEFARDLLVLALGNETSKQNATIAKQWFANKAFTKAK